VRDGLIQPGKRLFDIVVAAACLALLTPLMILVAAAVKLYDAGPVLYRQRRVGRGGKTFEMIKFRSMVVNADRLKADLHHRNVTNGLLFKVDGDPRITPVGRVIRRLSIDELPQLWNVLRGDMSMVGPRPLPVEPADFGWLDNQRHRVAPGITGYWQLSGGNGLTYEDMIELDLFYIDNWSLSRDLWLLVRTVPGLFVRTGPH
jgi:lipopolysaccharide/colanic/teichoic acid biosynthesis glycosyltransferase